MAWDRFSYICRSACANLSEKDDVSSYLSNLDKQPSTDLYGKEYKKQSLFYLILNRIGKKNTHEALDVLTIYKDLNLAGEFEQPMKFKRFFAYLFAVFVVFLMTSGIFIFLVTPKLYNFAIDMGNELLIKAVWYQDNWGFLVAFISLFFIITFLITIKLKQLFNFDTDIKQDIIFKYLLFKSIRQSYFNIIDILQFPVNREINTSTSNDSKLISHLRDMDNSKIDISTEMQTLLVIELNKLLEKCEKQTKLFSIIIAITIIYSIFLLLSGIYSPIFTLGEVL